MKYVSCSYISVVLCQILSYLGGIQGTGCGGSQQLYNSTACNKG